MTIIKSIFFCDIRNTFNKGDNRELELKKFVNYLKKLDDNDELSFSFLSADDENFVHKYLNELYPYTLNSKILFGNQYAGDKKFKLGKEVVQTSNCKFSQVLDEVNNGQYDKIYYADDENVNLKIVENSLSKKYNKSIVTFNPKKGITDLNNLLDGYFQKDKHKTDPVITQ